MSLLLVVDALGVGLGVVGSDHDDEPHNAQSGHPVRELVAIGEQTDQGKQHEDRQHREGAMVACVLERSRHSSDECVHE